MKPWKRKRAEARQKGVPDRHPLADHAREVWITVVVIVVIVCAPRLSPEQVSLIGVLATLLGSHLEHRAVK